MTECRAGERGLAHRELYAEAAVTVKEVGEGTANCKASQKVSRHQTTWIREEDSMAKVSIL